MDKLPPVVAKYIKHWEETLFQPTMVRCPIPDSVPYTIYEQAYGLFLPNVGGKSLVALIGKQQQCCEYCYLSVNFGGEDMAVGNEKVKSLPQGDHLTVHYGESYEVSKELFGTCSRDYDSDEEEPDCRMPYLLVKDGNEVVFAIGIYHDTVPFYRYPFLYHYDGKTIVSKAP